MNIIEILSGIANTPHHQVNIDKLIKDQDFLIKKAFSTKDSKELKKILNDNSILADRDKVVQF